ncbi:MAG: VOC family protein [Cyanobacteria bacterium Co-bin13]|nr:VOC family protein [Cyanobacteria bacterium Co-bin13]
MITHVGTVSVFVRNQDRAKTFYTDVLGMKLRMDVPLYPGAATRWISVVPASAETEIILYLPDANWTHYKETIGQAQALTLSVDDIAMTHRALQEKGVHFVQEPKTEAWGTFAAIEDSEGNRLLLVQAAS